MVGGLGLDATLVLALALGGRLVLRWPSTLALGWCNPLLTNSMNIIPIRIRLHIIPMSLKVGICTINYKGQDFLLVKWAIKYF